MRKFRVNRKKWRFGGRQYEDAKGDTALLNEEGYMCCLGFACNQLGKVSKQNLEGTARPGDLDKVVNGLSGRDAWGDIVDSRLSIDAMDINDDSTFSNKDRERSLEVLFRDAEIEVEFYGEYDI